MMNARLFNNRAMVRMLSLLLFLVVCSYQACSFMNPLAPNEGSRSLNSIVSKLDVSAHELTIDREFDLSADLVIPEEVRVSIAPGGMIHADGFQLVIQGEFQAGLYQVFDQELRATFKKGTTVYPQWWGAKGDGVADDTQALRSAIDGSDRVVELSQKQYSVLNSIKGETPSLTAEAASLDRMLYVFGKSNLAIQNGRIFAANPEVSSKKLVFPSTLAFDGCTAVSLNSVEVFSKGESFGDADSSQPLSFEARRRYLAQNGGHALLFVRSSGLKITNSTFKLSGSVAPVYISSSEKVVIENTLSTPKSLGYAAFAFDSWAGPAATSGFQEHDAIVRNCSTHADGARYGSKAGVATEDADVHVLVQGGQWRDSYPNGRDRDLGNAFVASNSNLTVDGASIDNCASVGRTTQSTRGPTQLVVRNTTATNLRTAVHIQSRTSFGPSEIRYEGSRFQFSPRPAVFDASLGDPELSRTSVLANMKAPGDASSVDARFINCTASGMSVVAQNSRAVYGSLLIQGGSYAAKSALLNSAGFGPAVLGAPGGVSINGGASFSVSDGSIANPLLQLSNVDSSNVYTYLSLVIDPSVRIESFTPARVDLLSTSGPIARSLISASIINGYLNERSYGRRLGVRLDRIDGLANSYLKAHLISVDGTQLRAGDRFITDSGVVATLVSPFDEISLDDGTVRQGWFVESGGLDLRSALSTNKTYWLL